jgi:hypothetical protein
MEEKTMYSRLEEKKSRGIITLFGVVLLLSLPALFLQIPKAGAMVPAFDDNLKKVAAFGPDNLGVLTTGVGMVPGGSGSFSADIPGEVRGGYLYILSHELIKNGLQFPEGDPDVAVTITAGDGTVTVLDTVPVVYEAQMPTGHKTYVNTMDITRFISPGTNTFDIFGMDVDQANGAAAVIIYGHPDETYKTVTLKEGCDFGFYRIDPPVGPDTETYLFRFDAVGADRAAAFTAVIGDAMESRGDEVFAITGGKPVDYLKDRDGDGKMDILRRDRRLNQEDFLPLGNDPANAAGRKEAARGAISLAEDLLGVPLASGGYSRGGQLDIFRGEITIPASSMSAGLQLQSEDPENGDSFQVAAVVFELEAPYAWVGDLVWLDSNGNGIPDTWESGIAGVPVNIDCDRDGDGLTDLSETTVTDVAGLYLFAVDPIPDPGNCLVTFDGGAPQLFGLQPTTPDFYNTGVLDPLEEDLDNDFGFRIAGAPGETMVGDLVWLDENGDGFQDPDEPGIPDITVTMSWDFDGDTVMDHRVSDETGAGGLYLFTLPITSCDDPVVTAQVTVDTSDPDLPAGALPTTTILHSIPDSPPGPILQCGQSDLDNDFGFRIPPTDGATRATAYFKKHPCIVEEGLLAGSGTIDLGFMIIDNLEEAMGLLWARNSYRPDGTGRPELEKARIKAGKQLLAAIFNENLLGTSSGGITAEAPVILAGDNVPLINHYKGLLEEFNNSGKDISLPEYFRKKCPPDRSDKRRWRKLM